MEDNSFSSCVGSIVITIFVIFLVFKAFDYFEKMDNIPANEISRLSDEDIKNDLLGNKIGSWTFDKLEEFLEFDIKNYKIIDDFTLEIDAELKLKGYDSNKIYIGSIIITYIRSNEKVKYWTFKNVTGNVYPDSNNLESENFKNIDEKKDIGTVLKDATREAVIEAVFETIVGSNNNSIKSCDWCGEEIKSKLYHVNKSFDYCEVSSVNGEGNFHQNCANYYCNNKRN